MRTGLMTASITSIALALLSGGAAAAEKELYLFNWANYISPAELDRFKQETGITVHLDTYDSNGALLAKLEGGASGYDIIVPSGSTLKSLIDRDMLIKIDAKELSNFKNVKAPFDTLQFDPDRAYSAPYTWGMTGYTYDADDFPNGKPDDSWKPLFEPSDTLSGKIGMPSQDTVYYSAAMYLGLDYCSEDPKVAQQIFDLLQKQKPAVKVYSGSGAMDRLINGETSMELSVSGDYRRAKEKKPSLEFVMPKEGLGMWVDSFAIPKGAKNVENAKVFINWMMEPKNAGEAALFTGDGVSIAGAEAYMGEKANENLSPELAQRLKPVVRCSAKSLDLRSKVWTRLMN